MGVSLGGVGAGGWVRRGGLRKVENEVDSRGRGSQKQLDVWWEEGKQAEWGKGRSGAKDWGMGR